MRRVLVPAFVVGFMGFACSLELSAPPIGEDNSAAGGAQSAPSLGLDVGAAPPWETDRPEYVPVCKAPLAQGGAGGQGGMGGAGVGSSDLTVLLVFDKSGSMGVPWEDRTRWESASDAFLKGLEGVESQVTVGAIVFPQLDGCDVAPLESGSQIQFQKGTSFIERWNATEAKSEPRGGTPLGLAFQRADDAIREAEACGLLEGRFRVVVVTDGEPNCGTSESSLIHYAQSWRDKGVEVHVMGLPGSQQAARLLDRIAGVGGTEEHVPTENVRDAEDKFWHVVR